MTCDVIADPDPGSRIRFFFHPGSRIKDLGTRGQKSTVSRIQIRNTGFARRTMDMSNSCLSVTTCQQAGLQKQTEKEEPLKEQDRAGAWIFP
jgi:hypothetical protein